MRKYGLKISVWVVLLFFMISSVRPVYAQGIILPPPGEAVGLSKPFVPCLMTGVRFYPQNPFRFDFIVEPGDTGLSGPSLKDESTKLVEYFLATLTTPANDLWVNLSPYEGERIIPEFFGLTKMGRDLLAQDYILKQISSSLLDPNSLLGKEFWSKVYAKANAMYGTTDIPVDTFNKVWIVPGVADIAVRGSTAMVVKSHIKLMLDTDYLASNLLPPGEGESSGKRSVSPSSGGERFLQDVMREVILPELEREVNEGKNFATVRQVYNALILATWLKRKIIKDGAGLSAYVDGNKVAGVDHQEVNAAQHIWQQYVEAFKKGTVNLIREETDQFSGELIPRKYFSGGAKLGDCAEHIREVSPEGLTSSGKESVCWIRIDPLMKDDASFRKLSLLTAGKRRQMNRERFLSGLKAVAETLKRRQEKEKEIYDGYRKGLPVLYAEGIKNAGRDALRKYLSGVEHHIEPSRNGTQSQVWEGVFGGSRLLIKEVKNDEAWDRYRRWEAVLGDEIRDDVALPLVAHYVTLENVVVHTGGKAVFLKRVVVQDKVTPLVDAIAEIKKRYYNDVEGRQQAIVGILKQFLELFSRLFKRGVVGNPHGFLIDYGITSKGHLVVMDVGDLAGVEDEGLITNIKKHFYSFMVSTSLFAEMEDGQKVPRIVDAHKILDARWGGFVKKGNEKVWDENVEISADPQDDPETYNSLLFPNGSAAFVEKLGSVSADSSRRIVYQGPQDVTLLILKAQREYIKTRIEEDNPVKLDRMANTPGVNSGNSAQSAAGNASQETAHPAVGVVFLLNGDDHKIRKIPMTVSAYAKPEDFQPLNYWFNEKGELSAMGKLLERVEADLKKAEMVPIKDENGTVDYELKADNFISGGFFKSSVLNDQKERIYHHKSGLSLVEKRVSNQGLDTASRLMLIKELAKKRYSGVVPILFGDAVDRYYELLLDKRFGYEILGEEIHSQGEFPEELRSRINAVLKKTLHDGHFKQGAITANYEGQIAVLLDQRRQVISIEVFGFQQLDRLPAGGEGEMIGPVTQKIAVGKKGYVLDELSAYFSKYLNNLKLLREKFEMPGHLFIQEDFKAVEQNIHEMTSQFDNPVEFSKEEFAKTGMDSSAPEKLAAAIAAEGFGNEIEKGEDLRLHEPLSWINLVMLDSTMEALLEKKKIEPSKELASLLAQENKLKASGKEISSWLRMSINRLALGKAFPDLCPVRRFDTEVLVMLQSSLSRLHTGKTVGGDKKSIDLSIDVQNHAATQLPFKIDELLNYEETSSRKQLKDAIDQAIGSLELAIKLVNVVKNNDTIIVRMTKEGPYRIFPQDNGVAVEPTSAAQDTDQGDAAQVKAPVKLMVQDHEINLIGEGNQNGIYLDPEVPDEVFRVSKYLLKNGLTQLLRAGNMLVFDLTKKEQEKMMADFTGKGSRVPSVLSYGFTDEGHPFIAVERIFGRSWDQILKEGATETDWALLEDFLKESISDRYVLRDLRPPNLMNGTTRWKSSPQTWAADAQVYQKEADMGIVDVARIALLALHGHEAEWGSSFERVKNIILNIQKEALAERNQRVVFTDTEPVEGGIDFNNDKMTLNEDAASKNQAAFDLSGQNPDQANVLGYRPVILGIVPVTD
ncbi:MAG: hypothetical protein HQL22_03920, partial [Candidatus Omnitrophica bacterium]|nr:hypothetical protein [Candidatus Omnitrophota bacterium]